VEAGMFVLEKKQKIACFFSCLNCSKSSICTISTS